MVTRRQHSWPRGYQRLFRPSQEVRRFAPLVLGWPVRAMGAEPAAWGRASNPCSLPCYEHLFSLPATGARVPLLTKSTGETTGVRVGGLGTAENPRVSLLMLKSTWDWDAFPTQRMNWRWAERPTDWPSTWHRRYCKENHKAKAKIVKFS